MVMIDDQHNFCVARESIKDGRSRCGWHEIAVMANIDEVQETWSKVDTHWVGQVMVNPESNKRGPFNDGIIQKGLRNEVDCARQ
jgi:hypothetical protein